MDNLLKDHRCSVLRGTAERGPAVWNSSRLARDGNRASPIQHTADLALDPGEPLGLSDLRAGFNDK